MRLSLLAILLIVPISGCQTVATNLATNMAIDLALRPVVHVAVEGGIELKPRPGATMEVILIDSKNPSAAVILMEGGSGSSRIINSARGFLSMTREDFADKGFFVAMPIAPSDQTEFRGGMHPDYRISNSHLKDIGSLVTWIKKKTNLPVWIVGVSFGAVSAAYYAVNGKPKVDGVVLNSSVTLKNRFIGDDVPVTNYALDKITVPLLAVGHEDDECPDTPASGAKEIVAASISSPNAKVLIVSGGSDMGRHPCHPGTPHTFNGVEDEVVSAITRFIKSNLK